MAAATDHSTKPSSAAGNAGRNKASKAASNRAGRLIIACGALACLTFAVLLLYAPLREYYVVYRANQQLLGELASVQDRNAQIRLQIDRVNTLEGISDRARERYGWVPHGETAVNITGLDISDSTTRLPAQVETGSGELPREWWTDLCDLLFAVEPPPAPEPVPDPFLPDTHTGAS